jgi:hypothetical protein
MTSTLISVLLPTYEKWKVLVSLAKKIYFYCKFSRFRTFYILKTSLERKKNFRLSHSVVGIAGVAVGFWTNFEVQLAQSG